MATNMWDSSIALILLGILRVASLCGKFGVLLFAQAGFECSSAKEDS